MPESSETIGLGAALTWDRKGELFASIHQRRRQSDRMRACEWERRREIFAAENEAVTYRAGGMRDCDRESKRGTFDG